MPKIARYMIRCAFVWLSAALLTAALLLADQALELGLRLGLQPVFYHLLMVGALLQLIFGVALWLFPVHTKEQPRGDERLAWAGFGLLNLGLLLRVAGEPLLARVAGPLPATLLLLSALLQTLAVGLFIVLIWPRVKTRAPRPPARPCSSGGPDAAA